MSIDAKEKQVLLLHVTRHARRVSLELKRSFLFHFFISHDKKDLKDLAGQISKFIRFKNLVRYMNIENLRMLEEKLNIFEDEIKKIEKEFEFKSYIKNKGKTNVQRKKNLENKKGKLTYPKETEDLSCKKAPKNKLLQMATG